MKAVLVLICTATLATPCLSLAQDHLIAAPPDAVDCSRLRERGIEKQANLHAAHIRIQCGVDVPGSPATAAPSPTPPLTAGANVNTITGTETYPQVTQSESVVWSSDGSVIVVNYNDSAASPANFSGVSTSSDGGSTFTRLLPSPFASGHGTNYGDPILVYNAKLAKWFAGDLATGCGGRGLGLWTSTDALNWSIGACAHSGTDDDRDSMWVDNNPTSPWYGRMYISWNDFSATGGQALYATYSDDGATWSVPAALTGTFIRNVQITGGADGAVFVAAMNEGSGGFSQRTNLIYRSTNGGVTWTEFTMGPSFLPVGDSYCTSYFVQVNPIWRHMGWGQPGVGPGGIVHYVYAGQGLNSGDHGDIYYTRSADNGATWSTPIVINTDQLTGSVQTQWMPSLSVTSDGRLHAYWYDRRNSTNGSNYEIWGRQSADNGVTWLADERISDTLIPQPAQLDPNVAACYAGDYNYATANGTTHYAAWTDGRVSVSGYSQQDVFFAAVPSQSLSPDFVVSQNPSLLTVQEGNSGVSTATVTSLTGFAGVVGLSCSGQPAGIGCDFVPASVSPPADGTAQSQLTVSVPAGFTAGTYNFSVAGASGTLTHSTPISLVVTPLGDFSVVCNQNNFNVTRSFTKNAKCSVRSQSGFTDTVALSCAGLPAGASCGFQPSTVTPPANGAGSFALTLSGSNVAPGQYQVQVTGTSGTVVRTETLNLKVKQ